MHRRTLRALAAAGLVAGLGLAGCSTGAEAPTAAPPPAPPAAAPSSSSGQATTTTGLLPPGVPTEGSRPPTENLSLAAEPESAPPPATPPPGRQIQVGDAPEGIVVDPVTRTVAVAKRNPNELVLLDADSGAEKGRVALPGFVRHLQLQAPGGPVLVPVESANALVRVDLPTGPAQAQIFVGTVPHDATAAPNGTVFTADELGGTITAVRGDAPVKVFTDSVQPAGMAVAGNILAMVDVRENTYTTYDTDGLTILGEIPAGAGPTHMVADRQGRMIVTDTRGNQILVFDSTAAPRQLAAVPQAAGPYGITYDPTRNHVWVASSGGNEVVGYDMTTPQPREIARIPTVQNPYTVGVDPVTGRLFVGGVSGGVIQVVDPAV